jgi:hypothetical protein
MKKSVSAFFIALCFFACSSRPEQAAVYNDTIVDQQLMIVSAFQKIDSLFNDSLADKQRITQAWQNLSDAITDGQLALDSLGPFQKDPLLQNAARELFITYGQLARNDYNRLLNFKLIPPERFSPAMADSCNAIQRRIRTSSDSAQHEFIARQSEFGSKYHLTLK